MSKQGKSKVSKTSASKGPKSASKKTSSRVKSKSTNSKVASKSKYASKCSKSNTAGISLPTVMGSTLKKIQVQYVRQKNPNYGKSSSVVKRTLSNLSKVQSKKSSKTENFDVMEIERTVDKLPPGVGKSGFPPLPELVAVAPKSGSSKAAKSKSAVKSRAKSGKSTVSHTKSKPKSTIKSKASQVKSTPKASKSNCTGKTKSKTVKSAAKSKKSK